MLVLRAGVSLHLRHVSLCLHSQRSLSSQGLLGIMQTPLQGPLLDASSGGLLLWLLLPALAVCGIAYQGLLLPSALHLLQGNIVGGSPHIMCEIVHGSSRVGDGRRAF